MRFALLLMLPALAACQAIDGFGPEEVVEGPLRVIAAEARANRVTFRVSDGSRCVGQRPEGTESGWSGVTDPDCGYALPYRVLFRQGGSSQRFVIEDPRGTLTEEGVPGPRAEIFVTDVDGQRKLFVTPLGPNTRLVTPEETTAPQS
ncbi:MAG: hypothetical protein AAGE03_14935 [Pseudomonadota bacterium]